jgi:hypothetical protein
MPKNFATIRFTGLSVMLPGNLELFRRLPLALMRNV